MANPAQGAKKMMSDATEGFSGQPPEEFDFLAPPQGPDELGRLGPYRILKLLGQGGMGAVFQAEDPRLQRAVALKVMLPEYAKKASSKDRFLREARAAAQIEHDNIVGIYQVEEDRGIPYIAMQFLKGMSLDDYIKAQKKKSSGAPLKVPQILKVGREIAKGLGAAHERGMIHRDIKPANIWLDGSAGGRVRILDFGLARTDTDQQHLTQSGMILGTPAYMAPEQARAEKVDARADLFSLGVVLYRLCTGDLPFKGKDTMSTLMALATTNPPSPQEINADIPAGLSELIQGLLEKDVAKRIGSAQEVVKRIIAIEKQLAANPTVPGAPAVSASFQLVDAPQTEIKPARAQVNTPSVSMTAERTENIAPIPPPKKKTPAAPVAPPSRPSPNKAGRRPMWPWLVGGGALALLLVILTLILIRSPDGTLLVEVTDPDIDVVVRMSGVVVQDRTTKREFQLKPGDGVVEVFEKGGIGPLTTKNFTLNRGEKKTLSVTAEVREARSKVGNVPSSPVTSAGWTRLFNGKDLTGWSGRKDLWSVRDGAIVGSFDSLTYNTFLHSDKSYRDFEFKCTAKLVGGKGNTGIQFRSFLPDKAKHIVGGPQLDMGAGYWGTLWGEQFGGLMKAADKEAVAKTLRDSEFNEYYVLAVGKRVTLKINGVTTVDDVFEKLPPDGIFALQLHTGPPMEVHFKDLWIKELETPRPAITGDWTPLFNGKDLTGWSLPDGKTGAWKVENGLLTCEGANSHIYSTRDDFGDFHLRVEAKVNTGGNSGVFFRVAKPHTIGQGYEAQIDNSVDKQRTGSLYRLVPVAETLVGPDAWFVMEVIARGPQIEIHVDGKKVVDYVEKAANRMWGHFALQHSQPQTKVYFRRIEIKELTPPKASSEGFTPLFNGKDLTGWATAEGGGWKVQDGAITCTGEPSHIYTLRGDYGDFHLRAEVKINDRGNGGIYFRCLKTAGYPQGLEAQICHTGPDPQRTGGIFNQVRVTEQLVPSHQWYTHEIIAQGSRFQVFVNGKQTADFTDPGKTLAKGFIALQHHDVGTQIHFRKIEIKELTPPPPPPPINSSNNPAAIPLNRDNTRHQEFLALAQMGDVDVVFLGDSITQGWSNNAPWKKYFAPLKAVNFGIGGDQTGHVLWRITEGKELDAIRPKVIVLAIGTNNSNNHTAPQIAEGISVIINTIHQKHPATKVLLLAVLPRAESANAAIRQKVADINRLIVKLDDGGRRVKFLDTGPLFLEPDGSISKQTMPDALHLSPRAYEIWADAIAPVLKEMLK